jgi:phosphohistidine phosphatase
MDPAAAHATIELSMQTEKRLFVLRHAKSSWDDPGLDDRDRPLAPRGVRSTKLLARHVRAQGIEPTQVLCSPSRRTRETLDGVAPGGETLIEPELYEASCGTVIERLQRVPEGAASVMVIGHNPTMQMLVLRLIGANGTDRAVPDDDTGYVAELQRKFPTGALATLAFDCTWSELGPGCARLVGYVNPKSLH